RGRGRTFQLSCALPFRSVDSGYLPAAATWSDAGCSGARDGERARSAGAGHRRRAHYELVLGALDLEHARPVRKPGAIRLFRLAASLVRGRGVPGPLPARPQGTDFASAIL